MSKVKSNQASNESLKIPSLRNNTIVASSRRTSGNQTIVSDVKLPQIEDVKLPKLPKIQKTEKFFVKQKLVDIIESPKSVSTIC